MKCWASIAIAVLGGPAKVVYSSLKETRRASAAASGTTNSTIQCDMLTAEGAFCPTLGCLTSNQGN